MEWIKKYLTIQYKEMNCSKFVEFVLRDHFKIEYRFPQSEGSLFNQSEQIRQSIPSFAVKTNEPKTGDLVLMHGRRRMCHVGLYIEGIDGASYVLHTESSMGTAALHRFTDLIVYGYSVEGIYSWLK